MNEYVVEIIRCTHGEETVIKEKLVRCKDCKYNNGGRCSWHGGAGYKWIVGDGDYCSHAEKRVIHCKDCKHNDEGKCTWHNSSNYSWIVGDGDYCSCAERKEE